MHDESWREAATRQVRVLQIIVGALVAGVVFFLMIALILRQPADLAPGTLTAVAVIFSGAILITYPVAMRILVATARRQVLAGTFRVADPWKCGSLGTSDRGASDLGAGLSDAECLLSLFQRKTIFGAAMVEGCTFFAVIAYFIDGGFVSLGLAVALSAGLAAHFPTLSRITGWVDRQIELLEQERTLGGNR